MGLFRRRSEERATIDLSSYAQLWSDYGLGYSPVSVGRANALTHAASSACIDTLATSISQTPVDVVRPRGDRRLPMSRPPELVESPSALVAQDVWLYQLMESILTDGNAFAEVTAWTGRSQPAQLELVDPALVTNRRIEDGYPTVTLNSERRRIYPHGDLWHMPGRFVRAGSPFAESPITRARSTIGGAIAARDYGSQFFGDGGHPGAIIQSENELTEEQAKAIKRSFLAAVKGNREPAVFGSGLDYEPILANIEDGQFIELQRFAIEEACRFWRVPPSMVYAAVSGQAVTYANVTQSDLAYLKHSLEGHYVRIERAWSALLSQQQMVRFNRNAFLRSDPTTRSEVVDRRLANRTLTVNEARALEDESPFDGDEFDEPGVPEAFADSDDGASARDIAELIQKIYLGVGKVLTSDEAREIANRAGAGLDGDFEPFAMPAAGSTDSGQGTLFDDGDMTDE